MGLRSPGSSTASGANRSSRQLTRGGCQGLPLSSLQPPAPTSSCRTGSSTTSTQAARQARVPQRRRAPVASVQRHQVPKHRRAACKHVSCSPVSPFHAPSLSMGNLSSRKQFIGLMINCFSSPFPSAGDQA